MSEVQATVFRPEPAMSRMRAPLRCGKYVVILLVAALNLLAATSDAQDGEAAGYSLLFMEYPEFDSLPDGPVDANTLLHDAKDVQLDVEQRVRALVQLGAHLEADEIPADKLILLSSGEETPEVVKEWSIIVAGKKLTMKAAPSALIRWYFSTATANCNSAEGKAALMALIGSGVSKNALRRELSQIMRNPNTDASTCELIGGWLHVSSRLLKTFEADEAVNCILDGYDVQATPVANKKVLWEQIDLIMDTLEKGDIDLPTRRAVHELGAREFAIRDYPEELRIRATLRLEREEPIGAAAVNSARESLADPASGDRMKRVCKRVIESANQPPTEGRKAE